MERAQQCVDLGVERALLRAQRGECLRRVQLQRAARVTHRRVHGGRSCRERACPASPPATAAAGIVEELLAAHALELAQRRLVGKRREGLERGRGGLCHGPKLLARRRSGQVVALR